MNISLLDEFSNLPDFFFQDRLSECRNEVNPSHVVDDDDDNLLNDKHLIPLQVTYQKSRNY